MHAAMTAFMVQRMEMAAKTNEIMARFRPIAPKPPPPPTSASSSSSGARKRGRQEDYSILPPCHLASPDWWPACVGSVAWERKGKGQFIPNQVPLSGVPAGDENLVRLSLAVPGTFPSPEAHKAIKPRPARPLRTTICIDSSNIIGPKSVAAVAVSNKTTMEVEADVEHDMRPVVVSGYDNHVFLVNDAYNAMVGQPMCPWLESLLGTGTSRRINGEVVLNVLTFSPTSRLPNAGGAFPCTARISWELDGATASLTVPCAVERLTGNSGKYRSIWRFDSTRARIIYCLA